MQVYLSSYRWGDRFADLVARLGTGARVLVVSAATDFIADDARDAYRRNVHDPAADLRDAGLQAEELDLRPWFGRPDGLAELVASADMVWAAGGNAFLLRRALRQSGLDRLLLAARARQDFIYGGWSAGAVVAAPSLRGLELMDDPAVLADGYEPAPVWDGLGLVDFAIVPHFESDHPEAEAAQRAHAFMTAQGIAHRTLRDGEALFLDVAP